VDLVGKRICPKDMEVLYSEPFSEASLAADFDIRSGEWSVQDGWLTGKNPLNAPGMVISRAEYLEDVMLEFRARTILPSTHDIDVMWNGSWNFETNERHVAYVAGLEGWWDGKVGIEKSPEYKLVAATGLFNFEPGRTYFVQCGSVAGHVFCAVDGDLVLEVMDPDPIDSSTYGLIGFEAYCSHIQFTDFRVLRASYTATDRKYELESTPVSQPPPA